MRTLACLLAVPLLLGSVAIPDSGECFSFKGMNREIAGEVRKLIEGNLKVGASSEKIEAFLAEHLNGGSYDRFVQSYNAIVRAVAHDPKIDQAVVIRLYVRSVYRIPQSVTMRCRTRV